MLMVPGAGMKKPIEPLTPGFKPVEEATPPVKVEEKPFTLAPPSNSLLVPTKGKSKASELKSLLMGSEDIPKKKEAEQVIDVPIVTQPQIKEPEAAKETTVIAPPASLGVPQAK